MRASSAVAASASNPTRPSTRKTFWLNGRKFQDLSSTASQSWEARPFWRSQATHSASRAYQLVRASCASNNWLRRQHTVHFRRYDRNSPAEYSHFASVLINLLAHIPTVQRLDKIGEEWVMRVYISAVGCIGSLKRALLLALQHGLRTGEKMTEEFILQFVLHNVVALEIAKEARIGEHLLLDVTTNEIEQVLNSGPPLPDAQECGAMVLAKPKPKAPAGGKVFNRGRRIGERKSSRDPVEVHHDKKNY